MERYTERQQGILAKIQDQNGREYQQSIYDAALEIWRAIQPSLEECLPAAQSIILDLCELANNNLRVDLSNPMEKYDPIALEATRILAGQDHSGNTFYYTIVELTKVIKDFTGEPVSAFGLRNGAVIEIQVPSPFGP